MYVERCCEAIFVALEEFTKYRWKKINITEVHFVDVRKEIIVDVMNKTFQNLAKQQQVYKRPVPPAPQTLEFASGYYENTADNSERRKSQEHYTFNPDPIKKIDEWRVSKTILPAHINTREFVDKSENFACSQRRGDLNLPTERSDSDELDSYQMLPLQFDVKQYAEPVRKTVPLQRGNLIILGDVDNVGMGSASRGKTHYQEDNVCFICLESFTEPMKLKKCGHIFCLECITESFSQKPVCPVCSTVYAAVQGDQPINGIANVYRDHKSLPGYSCGTLIISYIFSDGMQEDYHPEPGEPYIGIKRQAYLPDNVDGRKVLQMLKEAFLQRLTFTVGRSRTTEDNVVTWNDIHHKTRREGGPEKFGYPDEGYLERVTEELNAKGIGL